jgi:SNF2-related domain
MSSSMMDINHNDDDYEYDNDNDAYDNNDDDKNDQINSLSKESSVSSFKKRKYHDDDDDWFNDTVPTKTSSTRLPATNWTNEQQEQQQFVDCTIHQQQQQQQQQQQHKNDDDDQDDCCSYHHLQEEEENKSQEQIEIEENELRRMILKEFEENKQQQQSKQNNCSHYKTIPLRRKQQQRQSIQDTSIHNDTKIIPTIVQDFDSRRSRVAREEDIADTLPETQQQVDYNVRVSTAVEVPAAAVDSSVAAAAVAEVVDTPIGTPVQGIIQKLEELEELEQYTNNQQQQEQTTNIDRTTRKIILQQIQDEHRMAAQRRRQLQQEYDDNQRDNNNSNNTDQSDSSDDDDMDDEDYIYIKKNYTNNNDDDDETSSFSSNTSSSSNGSSTSLYTAAHDNNDINNNNNIQPTKKATTVINLSDTTITNDDTNNNNNNNQTDVTIQSRINITSFLDIKKHYIDDDPINFTVSGLLETLSTGKCWNTNTMIIDMSPPSPPFYYVSQKRTIYHINYNNNDNDDSSNPTTTTTTNDNNNNTINSFTTFQQSLLKLIQKRALGFMYEIECGRLPLPDVLTTTATIPLSSNNNTKKKTMNNRGGWLSIDQSDSVVVVIALICSNQLCHQKNDNNNNNNYLYQQQQQQQNNLLVKTEIKSESNIISLQQQQNEATAPTRQQNTTPTTTNTVPSTTREIVQRIKELQKQQYFVNPINTNQSTLKTGSKKNLNQVPESLCLKVKATVIITSNSLLGYWEDLFTHYSPTLIIERYHPPSKDTSTIDFKLLLVDNSNIHVARQLKNADVILTTATITWPTIITSNIIFHRIILDESHLLGGHGGHNYKNVISFRSVLRWCISSTPFGKATTSSTTCDNNNNIRKSSSSILSQSMSLKGSIQKQIDFINTPYVTSILFNQCLHECDQAITAKKIETYGGWERKKRNIQYYNFVYMIGKVMYRNQDVQEKEEEDLEQQRQKQQQQQQQQQQHPISVSNSTRSIQSVTRPIVPNPKIRSKKKFLKLSASEANAYQIWLSQDMIQNKLNKLSSQALGCTVNELESVLYYNPNQVSIENNFKITKIKKLVKYLKCTDLKQSINRQQTNNMSSSSLESHTESTGELGNKILVLTSDTMMQKMCYRYLKESLNNKCYIYQIGGTYSSAIHCDEVLRRFQLPLSKPMILICLWKPHKKSFGLCTSTRINNTNTNDTSSSFPFGISPSKLYCMEPWIDPSYQIQATKLLNPTNNNNSNKGKVVQFIYKDTFEENIDKLHIQVQSLLCDNKQNESQVYLDDSPPSCYIRDGAIGLDAIKVITSGLLL